MQARAKGKEADENSIEMKERERGEVRRGTRQREVYTYPSHLTYKPA
jgi:hypothetical protein